jgi:hypothetical protein
MMKICPSCNNDGYWIEPEYRSHETLYGLRSKVATSQKKVICTCDWAQALKRDAQVKFDLLQPGDVIRSCNVGTAESLQTSKELTVTHAAANPDGYVRAIREGEIQHLRVEAFLAEDWVLWRSVGVLEGDASKPVALDIDFNYPVMLRDGLMGLAIRIDGNDDDIDESFRNRVGVQVPGEQDIRWIPNNQLKNLGNGAFIQLIPESLVENTRSRLVFSIAKRATKAVEPANTKFVAVCDLLDDGQILVTRWREELWRVRLMDTESQHIQNKETLILDGYCFDESLQVFVLPSLVCVKAVREGSTVPFVAAQYQIGKYPRRYPSL